MPWPRFRLTGLRLFTLWTALVVLGFLGISFAMLYVSQKNYFANRNFRILAAIGSQVDDSIANHSRIFGSLLVGPDSSRPPRTNTPPAWFVEAKDAVPSVHYLGDPNLLPDATLPAENVRTSRATERRDGEPRLNLIYTPLGDDAVVLPVRLQPLLEPIFQQRRYLEAFETVMLATTAGEVWISSAHPRGTMRIHQLSALTNPTSAKDQENRFAALAQSTNVVDVSANGTSYKLFLQPCCASLGGDDASSRAFVVAGLVPAAELNSDSLAVPFSVAFGFGATLLIAIVGWPFLKLTMMGDMQRVTTTHILLVLTSTVGGLALLTVVMLDVYAYRRLGDSIDEQLQSLAQNINRNFELETERAYGELQCLVAMTAKPVSGAGYIVMPKSLGSYECAGGRPHPYPNYEIFAFVDRNGMQRVKLAAGARVSQPIDVSERAYFRETKAGRSWALSIAPPPGAELPLTTGTSTYTLYIESVRSWTNGQLRAVLATPTKDPAYPVATLTIPLDSLIRPLVLPGFEFAVIDGAGAVVFHSDPQRSQNENLFAETDFNRRLRAAVAAHRSKTLSLRYWGGTHRAHVMPMATGTPWSLVTLYDKQSSWALQEEWLVATGALLLLYMFVFIAALAFIVLRRRPGYASAAWPQAARLWQYVVLAGLYLIIHLAFWKWAMPLKGWPLVLAGFLTPALAFALTSLLLRGTSGRSHASRGWLPAYAIAAVSGLSLISVLPTVAFFTAAHDVHVVTYTKYRQLKLAQSLAARRQTVEAARASHYYSFFFETRLSDGSTCVPVEGGSAPDLIPGFLEDWLPYQSEASVEMRELLHDGAATDEWHWSHGRSVANAHLCLSLRYGADITVSSEPPRLFSPRAAPTAPAAADAQPWRTPRPFVELAAIIAALGLACYGVVRFICEKILLVGLAPPLQSNGSIASITGENELLLLSVPSTDWTAEGSCRINMTELACPVDAKEGSGRDPWLEALMQIDRCEQPTVVIDNVDARPSDAALAEKKVAFLEEICFRQNRTVVLTSQMTPGLIANRHAQLKPRWDLLFAAFLLRDVRSTLPAAAKADTLPRPWAVRLTEWLTQATRQLRTENGNQFKTLGQLQSEVGQGLLEVLARRRRRHLEAILTSECSASPHVTRICDDIRKQLGETSNPVQSSAQLLDLIAARAASHYRELWAACTPDEKLVLGHLAKDGLVNAKCRSIVRRLMVKGLIRSLPQLVLMNRTFERFVRSASRQSEITALEGARESSAWDEWRLPFAAATLGGCLFFIITQRELFDSTLAAMGAAATTIPAFVKAIGLSRENAGAVANKGSVDKSNQNT